MAVNPSQLPVADKADGTPGSPAPSSAQQIGGTDGTNLRVLKLDTDGIIVIPVGASTSALQSAGNASLASIDTDIDVALSTRASESTLSTLNGKVTNNYGAASGAVRTAAQIGNASAVADFNSGATGAQTLRVASNLYDGSANAVTSTSFDSGRPLDVYISQFRSATATRTTVTPTANTSTQALAANSARKWVIFINNSGAPFFLSLGTAATINNGIEIVQNGGRFIMEATFLYTGEINLIVGSNSRTLEIYEMT